jgi:hypothetical protein
MHIPFVFRLPLEDRRYCLNNADPEKEFQLKTRGFCVIQPDY